MTFNKFQIYGILKDYHWMLYEIKRIDSYLRTTDFAGVAQYGIEATLPHAVGIVGKALENEVIRRNKKSESLVKYCEKVNFVNERMDRITDEKQKVILDCILDGLSITAICKHLQMGRTQVTELRDKIVEVLAEQKRTN